MKLLVQILDFLFHKREIRDCDGDIYMHRWFVIRSAPFALFIHQFVRSDFERACHDHPWDFLVIPLWPGYIEHTPKKSVSQHHLSLTRTQTRRVYPIISTRFRRGEFRHRVELLGKLVREPGTMFIETYQLRPSWSLFFRFRKRKAWGFWLPTGWQEAIEWWQQHCSDTPGMVNEKPGTPNKL